MARNQEISNRASKINILGINITNLKPAQVLDKISGYLTDGKQHQIVTPNPEIILAATVTEQDEELFYILNRADLAVADGMGLKLASWFLGKNLPRITGADLLKDILTLAQEQVT